MKTLKRLFALVMVVVLMAGCTMKTNTGFVIDEKGKISVTMIMAMDDEMIDAYLTMKEDPSLMQAENPDDVELKEHTDAERWAFIDSDEDGNPLAADDDMEGFTKVKYDKDGFKGYVYTKEVGTLDEVTKESATERVNITNAISDEGSFENVALFTKSGDTYKSNMKLDMGTETSADDMKELEEAGAVIDMSFIIELPTKPISSNADSTENDGKTLKWNMTSAKNLEFEFKLTGSNEGTADAKDDKKDKKDEKDEEKSESSDSNILLYVGIGVGALVVIGIIVAIVVASSKKKAPAPVASAPVMGPVMQPSQPVEPPVQPVQPVQPVEPPVQPVQPVQPAEPAQPVDPNNMNNPQV